MHKLITIILALPLCCGCMLFSPFEKKEEIKSQTNTKTDEKRSIWAELIVNRQPKANPAPKEKPPAPVMSKEQREACKKAGVSDKVPESKANLAPEPKAKDTKPERVRVAVDGKPMVDGEITEDTELTVRIGNEIKKTETVQVTWTQMIISKAKETYFSVIAFCFVLIIGGIIVALKISQNWGLCISGGGLLGLVLAVALRDHPGIFSIVGGSLVICGICAAFIFLWIKHNKETTSTITANAQWAALKDIVGGVDNFKDAISQIEELTEKQAKSIINLLLSSLGDSQDKSAKNQVDKAQAEIKAKV